MSWKIIGWAGQWAGTGAMFSGPGKEIIKARHGSGQALEHCESQDLGRNIRARHAIDHYVLENW